MISQMSRTIREKLSTMLKEQSDPKLLQKRALPVMPKEYPGP